MNRTSLSRRLEPKPTINLRALKRIRTLIERLEPRYQLSGWSVYPALPAEALALQAHEGWFATDYQYIDPNPSLPSEVEHAYGWNSSITVGEGEDARRVLFSGTRFVALKDEPTTTQSDGSLSTDSDLASFLAARTQLIENDLEQSLAGSDWEVTYQLFDDGTFEQTARWISDGMPASELTVQADPTRFEEQVFLQFDAPPGLPKNYSLLTSVWDAQTGRRLVDQAHFDTDVRVGEDGWNVHLKHTHNLIEQGDYVVQVSIRDGRTPDSPIIDSQTVTISVPAPIHHKPKPMPVQEIVWRGQTVEVIAGEWSIQLDDSAPRSESEWDGPDDHSLHHGPGANPALAEALLASGLNVELVSISSGKWAHIRIDPSIDPQAVEAAFGSLPWVTGIEPSMLYRLGAIGLPAESAAPPTRAPVVEVPLRDLIASPASVRSTVESRFSVRESLDLFGSTGIDSQRGSELVESYRDRRDAGLVESTIA